METLLSGNLANMIITISLSLAVVYIFKLIADWNFKKVNDGLCANDAINNGNSAVAIRRAGMYLGLMIGALGTLSSSIQVQIMDQGLLILFMGLVYLISDKVVFSNINNTKEISKGNKSLAIAEAGLFIGTGIIAYASFAGNGIWYSSIVFFALGQVMLLLMTLVYETLYKEIKINVEQGKITSGIMLGSLMIAFSLILKSAIIGDFVSWEQDLISFFNMSVVGLIMLVLFANILIDKVFLPNLTIKESLEKDNIAPIILISSIKIGIALLINMAI